MADVFSNSSNNYSYPGLSPCVGAADDSYFEILSKKKFGIVSGRNIITEIDFSSISIPVSGWNQQSKILQSGEVVYIPGLVKGLCRRKQGFIIPDLDSADEDLDSYFMQVDLSINYYDSFQYIEANVTAESDYDNNVDIQIALNQAFSGDDINVSVTYDPSLLTFTGGKDGYNFNITNVELTTIDASENEDSPFVDSSIYELEEDEDSDVSYAIYPNGANMGIIIKGIYSEDTDVTDKWIYLNHPTERVVLYEAVEEVDCSLYYRKVTKKLDVGLNGASTETTISAADYLQKVTENEEWKKVGELYMWTSADDDGDCENKNLIDGFYLYNPQSFSVRIDYLIFV